MLAFVTSLRHPQNSSDYPYIEQLLSETLRSLASQTDDDYVVIIVGNQRPSFELSPNVHFVPVDYPAPQPHDGLHASRSQFVWDKGTKIGLGIAQAQRFSPDFVMIFDADDFVHRDLVGFAHRHDAGRVDGWVIDRGYMYSRSRGVYRRQDEFNRTCGTSFVVANRIYETSAHLAATSTQQDVADAYGERLDAILGAHREATEWFEDQGFSLSTLPFRGAVYQVDTNENHSGKALTGIARPAGKRVIDEFTLPVQQTFIERLRRGLAPEAWRETAQSLLSVVQWFGTTLSTRLRRVIGAR